MKIIKIYPRKKKPWDTEHCSKFSIKYSWIFFVSGGIFLKQSHFWRGMKKCSELSFFEREKSRKYYLFSYGMAIYCVTNAQFVLYVIYVFIYIHCVCLFINRQTCASNESSVRPSLLYTPLKSQIILIMIYICTDDL